MTCGGGKHSRVRLCDSPLPEAGGSLCPSNELFLLSITDDGTLKESGTEICNNNDCPTTTDKGKVKNNSPYVLKMSVIICIDINIRSKFYPPFNFRHIIRIGDERSNVLSRWRYNCYSPGM